MDKSGLYRFLYYLNTKINSFQSHSFFVTQDLGLLVILTLVDFQILFAGTNDLIISSSICFETAKSASKISFGIVNY